MDRSRRRRAFVLLLAGAALAGAVLAWPRLAAVLVEPFALVVWILLRVLVLSVHQAVYWLALVAAGSALLLLTLSRWADGVSPPGAPSRAPAHPVDRWRRLVERVAEGRRAAPAIVWDDFVDLTVTLQALEQHLPADHVLHEALRSGRVPLPAAVHAFLFPEARAPGGWVARLAGRIRGAPRRVLDRLTGRDRAGRLRAVDRLLSFLEESLETPAHGNRRA